MDSEANVKDPEKAKQYQKIRQRLTLIHLFLTPLTLLIVLVFPLSITFKEWAAGISTNPYGMLALYLVFYSLTMLLIDLPLSFYSGYVVEHRFGLSNQTLGGWISFLLKKTLLSFAFSLLLIEGLYAFIWKFPENWWLLTWAGYVGVSFVIGKIFPVFIVPLFYKYGKVEDEGLKTRIFDLSARYELPVQNVYSINLSKTTKKANAAFMGMGKTKRVVLSDTLISNFTGDEIETVVAHELGHYKHKDIWKTLIIGIFTSFLAFRLAFLLMEPLAAAFGLDGVADIAAMPLIFLIFFVFYLVLMPLQNGFSRMIERQADRFALKAYPHPDVFISCMDKLGRVNLADPDPHPVYEWFFYDHPSIGKRIKMAQAWKS